MSKLKLDDFEFFDSINKDLDIYVRIINYLDSKAISGELLNEVETEQLNRNVVKYNLATSPKEYITDLSDANNCGICRTWNDVILALKEQFKTGERIQIKSKRR